MSTVIQVTSKHILWTSLLALGLSVAGCSSEPSKQEILFKVKAVDTAQAPVADVQFFINDDPYMFGKTNQQGIYEDRYDAKVGDTLRLRLVPPEGYQIIGDSEISMQVTEGEGGPLEVDLNGMFAPPKRNFLFVVEGRPGDRVIIENKDVYQIDESRKGMFIHLGSPGQSFIVQVGESAAYQWTYAQNDEIYLITKQAQHTLVQADLVPQKVSENSAQAALAVATPRAPAIQIKSAARSSSRGASRRGRQETPQVTPIVKVPTEEPTEPALPEPAVAVVEPDPAPNVEIIEPAKTDDDIPPPDESAMLAVNNSTKVEESDGFEDEKTLDFNAPSDKVEPSTPSNEQIALAQPDTKEAVEPSTADLLATLQPSTTTPPPPPSVVQPKPPKPKATRSSKKKRASASAPPVVGDPLAGMSNQDIKERVTQIGNGYDSTSKLSSGDVRFLKQLSQKHGTAYNSAHRILGAYYYKIKEYRRQRDSLEIATKKGRYRSDAKVLLSLSQAYGHFKQYGKALGTLKRTEAKMRRLSGSEKANVYRTYAEYARLYFIAQRAKNPLRADTSLLDTAIQKWKRLQSISSAGSKDASDARKQIQKLEQMKSEAGMP